MSKLATPQTATEAAKWFRLAHDPMWLEWDHPEYPGHQYGALLTSAGDNRGGVRVQVFATNGGCVGVHEGTIWPDTFLASVESTAMDMDGNLSGRSDTTLLIVDFVVRINSPRITDTRPGDDLTALNRKRERAGKPPLFSYHVVDLNQQVKAGLRLAERLDAEEAAHGKRRLHWRRGHFKCCRTGVFWWNPHLAGKAELGVIDKEYVA